MVLLANVENQSAHGASFEGVVLVVDDEPAVRTTLAMVLESFGLRVIAAQDGIEALERYQAHRGEISLVIMDVTMPRLGGVEATIRLREMDPSAKVILSSGFTNSMVANAEPDAFLPKPYRINTLRELVRHVLYEERLAATPAPFRRSALRIAEGAAGP